MHLNKHATKCMCVKHLVQNIEKTHEAEQVR